MPTLSAGEVYFDSERHPANGEVELYLVLDTDTRYRGRRDAEYPVPEYEPTDNRSGKVLTLHMDSRRDWFDDDIALLRHQAGSLMRTRTGRYGRLQEHGMWVVLADRRVLNTQATELNDWYDQIPQIHPDNDTISRAGILWELDHDLPKMIAAEGGSAYGQFLAGEVQPLRGKWVTRARAVVAA